ncbi:hypothetical protein JYU34_001326 [Plutella xylostella]|uniref:Uncharacterized protein n=1 Tax=Plutella xylostella TaxID=51655 RepID=A0ABQ7R6J8_PLUXY|nr:hypothetical protein JYU34_001326 [Plutella xylostella]
MEETKETLEFKRALLRHMSERMRGAAAAGVTMLQGLARQYACPARDMLTVWFKLRAIALHKLRAHVSTGDAARAPCRLAAPAPLDWKVINLVLCRDANYCITTHESTRLPEQLRSLICLFHLVQACGAERGGGEEGGGARGGEAEAWLHVYSKYKESGRYMTLVGLQKRWWEVKRAAAAALLAYHTQLQESKKTKEKPATHSQPPYIYCAIAKRYPHVVTSALPRWPDLVDSGHVIVSSSSYKKKMGITKLPAIEFEEVTVYGDDRGLDAQHTEDIDDDIILVDKDIETIVLDDDEETKDTAKPDPNSIFKLNPIRDDISTRIIFDSDGSDDDYFFDAQNNKSTSETNKPKNPEDLDEEIRNLSLSIQQDILEGPQNASALTTEIDIKQEKDPVIESHLDIDNKGSSDVDNDANDREVSDNVVSDSVDGDDKTIENLINTTCSEVLSKINEVRIKKELESDVPDTVANATFEASNIKIESCTSLDQKPCLPIIHSVSSQREENTTNIHDSDSEPEDIKPNVDLKLIMIPLVPLRRLDQTESWKKFSLNNQIIASLINMAEFEPIKKRKRKSKPKDSYAPNNLTVMNVATHPLEAPRLIRLNSTQYRNYTPISLCKNPDFNTRLKRLPVGFLLSNRNKDLMEQCVPLTVDLDKLVIIPRFLSSNDDDVSSEDDVTVMPEAPAPRVLKKIQLPDIDDVRRINKGILTAEVTPIAVGGAPVEEAPADHAEENTQRIEDYNRRIHSLNTLRGIPGRRSRFRPSPRLQFTRAGDPVLTRRADQQVFDRDQGFSINTREVPRGARARRAKPYYHLAMSRQGWWRPERPPGVLDPARLHEALSTLQRSAPDTTTRTTYCCAARRHRAVNDARRRVCAKLQRQYAGDKDLHTVPCKRVNPEACSCCCAALLEPPGEAIERGSKALTRAINHILAGTRGRVQYMDELEKEILPVSTLEEKPTPDQPPDAMPAPADKPKRNRITKKMREAQAQKEKEEQERINNVTYEGWLEERNRASQVFGIKPKNYNTKSLASKETEVAQGKTREEELDEALTQAAKQASNDCVMVLSDSDDDPPLSVDMNRTELDSNNTTTDQRNVATNSNKILNSLLTEENVNAMHQATLTQNLPVIVGNSSPIDISSSPENSNCGENSQSAVVSIGALVQVDPSEANSAVNTTEIQKQMIGQLLVANNKDQQTNVGDGKSGQTKLLPVLLHADGSITPFVVGRHPTLRLPPAATVRAVLPHGAAQTCVVNQPATMPAEVASTLVSRGIAPPPLPPPPPPMPRAGGEIIRQGYGEFASQYAAYYALTLAAARGLTLPAHSYLQGRDPTCIVLTQMDTSHPIFLLAGDTVCVCEREAWSREPWLWGERAPVEVDPACLVKGNSADGSGLLSAAAPARVALGSKFYMKLQDNPLIYAQVLTILPNLREVRAQLLAGRGVFLVSHRGRERLQRAPRRRRLALNCRIHREALAALVRGLNAFVLYKDLFLVSHRGRERLQRASRRRRLALNCRIHREALAALVRGLNAFVSAEEEAQLEEKKKGAGAGTVPTPTAQRGAIALNPNARDEVRTGHKADDTVVVIDSDLDDDTEDTTAASNDGEDDVPTASDDTEATTPAAIAEAAPQPIKSKTENKEPTPTSKSSKNLVFKVTSGGGVSAKLSKSKAEIIEPTSTSKKLSFKVTAGDGVSAKLSNSKTELKVPTLISLLKRTTTNDTETNTPTGSTELAAQPTASQVEVNALTPNSTRSLLKPIANVAIKQLHKNPRRFGDTVVVDGTPATSGQRARKRPNILGRPTEEKGQFKKIRLTKIDEETNRTIVLIPAEQFTDNTTYIVDTGDSQDDAVNAIPPSQTEEPVETSETVSGENVGRTTKVENQQVTMMIEPVNSEDEQDYDDEVEASPANEADHDAGIEDTVDETVSEDVVDEIDEVAEPVASADDDGDDAILGL